MFCFGDAVLCLVFGSTDLLNLSGCDRQFLKNSLALVCFLHRFGFISKINTVLFVVALISLLSFYLLIF